MLADGMRDVVIVEAVRTPIGRGYRDRGYYGDVHPNRLLGACYSEVLARPGVDPAEADAAVTGCVQQLGEQALNIARNAWLQAGLPDHVAATTVDFQCGSSQQAVGLGAAMVAAGIHDVVVGAGVEHMGRVSYQDGIRAQDEFGEAVTPEMIEGHGFVEKHSLVGQGVSGEQIVDAWDIPRAELDELALRSHRLADKATREGGFEREMVPMVVDGETLTTDQGIRPDTSLEALAALRPAFMESGAITAGTSSQLADGAAAVLLTSAEKAERLGVRPRARIVDHVAIGCDPRMMLTGPIPATRKILERNGMSIDDIDWFEVNEAFASVVCAWQRELEPDPDRVNPRGGAMALGHPLGASGARLIATALHALEDEDKEIGLVTMCCGGGLGTATLIQRV